MTSAEKARAEAAVALLEADTFLAAVGINASSLLTIKELSDKNAALQEENKKLESYFYDPNDPSSDDE